MLADEQKKLVEDNLNLVYFVIHKYYPWYRSDEDMVSIATMGLLYAAEKWTSERGVFSTFAVTCIRNEIRREIRRLKCAGRNDTENLLQDNMIGEDLDIFDLIEAPVNIEKEVEQRLDVQKALANMNPKQAEIIKMRFIDKMKLNEICELRGCSRQGVQCAIERAVWSFKKLL